jgi:hypothetical protein
MPRHKLGLPETEQGHTKENCFTKGSERADQAPDSTVYNKEACIVDRIYVFL